MGLANPSQNFQDWVTQQWVILFGRKLSPRDSTWLMGPFGDSTGMGMDYISALAKAENLIIDKGRSKYGLIHSISDLNLPPKELNRLPKEVIDFYENTSNYSLAFNVHWDPFFRIGGLIIQKLFSIRLRQLNLPIKNTSTYERLKSEIITLVNPASGKIERTIWLRNLAFNNQIIYSGIYEICSLPSGETCIKAIFPLPNGNATVILKPRVGEKGDLILDSSGQKFGDGGFYFLLKDAQNILWTKYLSSFKDKLSLNFEKDSIQAEQELKLWGRRMLVINYHITKCS
ncbi:hypothetical protein GCM10007049_01100 [Echinicola pacifica]|uniref:Uncharacterized protein n=1 Tax=Echinicola pacifica TaxID=346377 RepID=A0A918PJI3_9BACT|nr:hypothetical protein [Echinicola pacifica]GGZ13114.1 hypothetical protein GCM10007049_01100 [Echinicola pacifica]